jgi:ubiquinone/menaquinone biosynthesis C-methylase UbiE
MNPVLKYFLGDYSEVGLNNKQDRLKWIQTTLLALPNGWKILDAGAGEQPFRPYCKHLTYVAQDFAKYDGKGNGSGIHQGSWSNENHDIISDITAIPVESGTFDAVMCTEVLEHVPHPVDAIKEMVRVLRPGGKIIITAPFVSLTHFAPYHYSTGFNRYFYEYWLEKYNCEIKELTFNGNYFESIAQELRYSFEASIEYSGLKPGLKEKLAQRIILSFLKRNSKQAPGSKDLLAFGLMIVAEKK